MNQPPSPPSPQSHPTPPGPADRRATVPPKWQELKREMEELHARLHYLKLLLKLGVKA